MTAHEEQLKDEYRKPKRIVVVGAPDLPKRHPLQFWRRMGGHPDGAQKNATT